jgi:hypothetical protein
MQPNLPSRWIDRGTSGVRRGSSCWTWIRAESSTYGGQEVAPITKTQISWDRSTAETRASGITARPDPPVVTVNFGKDIAGGFGPDDPLHWNRCSGVAV